MSLRAKGICSKGTRKNPKEKQSTMEIINLPYKEFKVIIIKVLSELRKKKKDEHSEKFNS